MVRMACREKNSVLGIWTCAPSAMRQPPLVNRRSSVNRLVNRQPVDAGERFASDCVIRQSICIFYLQSGGKGKSTRDAVLLRSIGSGECGLVGGFAFQPAF